VPLYFYRKQRFGVQEAVSQLQAAREDYTSTNQSLFFNVKDQYLVAKTSENLLKLFQEGIIPQAASSLESAITGYQVGNIDFLTLLNNLVTLFNFEITYYTYLTNYQTALARIEEIVDIPLIK
jgi:outer membrane protein TolC